ncbi:unnamed protein product [Xylocopa violacea]|uniref:Mitochondrial ribonuclease P catalytic subunit n=1 Tax=Xylocopa violacea TaxID=135666 RepID=A0ABP1NEP5_XYLVO
MIPYLRQTLLLRTRNTRKCHIYSKRFYKFCTTWEKQFANVLNHPTDVTKETWENMRKYAMESEEKPQIVDSYILLMCKQANYLDVGINYYKFLESNNYNPTVSTIALYLKLYDLKNDPITKADMDHILNLYNYITSQYQLFDSTTSDILVRVLCKIDEWREAIKVIEKFEMMDNNFLRSGYSALIAYLYNCGEIDLAYKYLIASIKTGIGPTDEAYSAYIMYCLKERDKFKERLTTITSLTCSTCKKSLIQADLTKDEYIRLEKAVLDKLIMKNIYSVTDPHEIKTYINFINNRKPYDVIIDGLNIVSKYKFCTFAEHLIYYKKKNKKVLVIGRFHMNKIANMKNLQDLADFFFVHNWSQDDLFVLYAAFKSGQNTIILSNDLMRQHKFALDNIELHTLFKKWQASHHYISNGCSIPDSRVQIDSIIQKQDNCWHIPYMCGHFAPQTKHTSTSNWACFNMCPQ